MKVSMDEILRLHREGMELADQADRLKGARPDRARELLLRAFDKERRAANAVAGEQDLEPTRSILLRSAAYLAAECSRYEDAIALVARGLDGHPPEELRSELQQLLETLPAEPSAELVEDIEIYIEAALAKLSGAYRDVLVQQYGLADTGPDFVAPDWPPDNQFLLKAQMELNNVLEELLEEARDRAAERLQTLEEKHPRTWERRRRQDLEDDLDVARETLDRKDAGLRYVRAEPPPPRV